jgi:hypothetical protein
MEATHYKDLDLPARILTFFRQIMLSPYRSQEPAVPEWKPPCAISSNLETMC